MLVNRNRGLDAVLDADEPFTADSLFAYIHVSGAAKAARKAIEASFNRHERIFAAASGTTSEASTRELILACYPDAEVRAPIDAHSSLISTTKAKRLLDWSVTKSCRRI